VSSCAAFATAPFLLLKFNRKDQDMDDVDIMECEL
jgi:hypothetical protein